MSSATDRCSKSRLPQFVGRSEGYGDEVSDLRLRCRAKRADGILNDPVRIGHAMVLPEMLKPGCDHEGLEEASVLGRILEDVPSICAVPPALLTQLPDGDEERVTLLSGDAVLDRYQYRTAIAIRVDRQDRRRPMHRGCEIYSRT